MSHTNLKKNFLTQISSFVKKNLKILIIILTFFLIFWFGFLLFKNLQEKKNIQVAEQYSQASMLIKKNKTEQGKLMLESIVNKGHAFYSPLALYLLIDSDIEIDDSKIIQFFDLIIKNNSIDKENLNLIKIKKAIYLINLDNEDLIIKTLNPIINSNSAWKNTAINLIVDYFLAKDQNAKAGEYIKLLNNKTNK
jgi:predicted negative regulator of RcsB-dependent stress response